MGSERRPSDTVDCHRFDIDIIGRTAKVRASVPLTWWTS